MGVAFVTRLILGVDVTVPGPSGKSFADRVLEGEFGEFDGDAEEPWGALEEHFVEEDTFGVYAACDEFTGESTGAVVGVCIQEVQSRGEAEVSAGLTEKEFLACLKQARATLASLGTQAPSLWLVPYTG